MTDPTDLKGRQDRGPSFESTTVATLAGILLVVLAIAVMRTACQPANDAFIDPSSVAVTVDLNTATAEELRLLPGLGAKLAADVVEYRRSIGLFKSIEQLTEIRGIKQAKLDQLRPYLIPLEGDVEASPSSSSPGPLR